MADRVGQQLGNYQLIRLLGRGGFADVYLGKHIYLDTQAAIKVLHTQLTSNDTEQFRQEARLIAHLEHPHIVRVLEFGVEGTTPFLVMDYAPHGTLRQHHPKGVPLPLSTIVSYVKQIAPALQFAHYRKLIHRDIKPENMLLDKSSRVVLSDFGIALITQSSRYQSTLEMAGTMAYMAPEQIQGKPRPASDQYGLGIVVYEWISGNRPFHGSLTELVGQHLSAPPPSLQEKIPTISLAVEQVVLKTLAKDPHQRFPSVQEFAKALEQASLGSPAEGLSLNQSQQPTKLVPQVSLSSPPSIQVIPSIQPPAQPNRAMPTDQLLAQNLPKEVHRLAAANQLGTPMAEYKVKPRIVKVNGYLILFALLAFAYGILISHANPWAIFSVFVLSLFFLFLGLGLWRTILAIPKRSIRVFIYTKGLVQIKASKAEVIQWSQVAAFWCGINGHSFFGFNTGETHHYAVLRNDGKEFHFNDDFLNVEGLGNTVIRESTRYLLPKAISTYNSGTTVVFGKISVSQQGIRHGKKMIPWNQITGIQAVEDSILIKRGGNKLRNRVLDWHTIPSFAMPNFPVLVGLLDHVVSKLAGSPVSKDA